MTKKIERSTHTLRNTLFDQLDKLTSGEITPQQAKAVTGLAGQIVNLSKLEIEAARFLSHDLRDEESIKRLTI